MVSLMSKRSRRYINIESEIDQNKEYYPQEAVEIVKRTSNTKFDETIELHIRTNADPRHSDQNVRGVTVLPHGIGKQIRVLVFAQGEAASIAEQSGADFVGDDELIAKVDGGWTDFDVSISTPDMMSKVGKLGKVLGRKGLMPNPRTGTVVNQDNIAKSIEEAKKGRVEFKLDRTSLIHVPIGKASFTESQLIDNLNSLVGDVVKSKPSGIKGEFIKTMYLTTTMGPSLKLDISNTTSQI
jgi:large subunit ribosomal protein L1